MNNRHVNRIRQPVKYVPLRLTDFSGLESGAVALICKAEQEELRSVDFGIIIKTPADLRKLIASCEMAMALQWPGERTREE